MSQRIVVKSFTDLALVLKLEDLPAEPSAEAPATATVTATQDEPPDLAQLLADLEAAGATLAEMTRCDEARRVQARRDLDAYDAVAASQREAEQARDRAQQVREQAEALAQTGFTEEVQTTAARIEETARRAETTATAMAEQRRLEAERLADQPDIQRLLAERRQHEEAEQARRGGGRAGPAAWPRRQRLGAAPRRACRGPGCPLTRCLDAPTTLTCKTYGVGSPSGSLRRG
ncbi:MAG: hypothetical protein KIS91_04595 [Anaerolineae bacterium]|nr:hypothetical protein [Anaerolineae bacterium]